MKLIIPTLVIAALPAIAWIGQPRVETKSPEPKWITLTNSTTNIYYGEWFVDNSDEALRKRYPELFAPKIQVVRTYAKTNKVESHESLERMTNGMFMWEMVIHPATTNLVTVHVLGYFSGTNAVELLEIEKPQTK